MAVVGWLVLEALVDDLSQALETIVRMIVEDHWFVVVVVVGVFEFVKMFFEDRK
jgi:hypothetical protein